MTDAAIETIATPDFDRYPCDVELVGAVLESATTIAVTWSDERVDRHHPWTLRENATDPGTTSQLTRERVVDIADWGDDVAATTVGTTGGWLTIRWAPDGLSARYEPGWLRHLGGRDWHPAAIRPAARTWDATAGEPPTFDGRAYLSDDDVLADALHTLGSHGLVRLRDLPDADDTVLAVGRRIGVVRPTHFGPDFDVVARADADSQAYTGARLGPHTDIPTRELPAGLQLLHCRTNTVGGGESLMVDGFAVAEHVREHDPDVFDALTRLRWVWANRSTETDVRWSAPVVGLDGDRIDEIRIANTLRLFPDMPHADVDRGYRAIRRFVQLADSERFRITFPFRPGDCVVFDNRRVLHGREAFEPGGGERHLRGCYVDRDDLFSRLRIHRRGRRAASGRDRTP